MIKNIYLYGSYVYGTNDSESDIDYILVVDYQGDGEKQLNIDRLNINSYSINCFQSMVNNHEVSALECIFLPEKFKIEIHPINFFLNIEKLRRSFSEKSSNSWVKAKKKIDIHNEYRLGRKSLFHSLRILMFGIQIIKYGKIVNYQEANWILEKIQSQDYKNWSEYKEFWQPKYNELRSEFRKLGPIK